MELLWAALQTTFFADAELTQWLQLHDIYLWSCQRLSFFAFQNFCHPSKFLILKFRAGKNRFLSFFILENSASDFTVSETSQKHTGSEKMIVKNQFPRVELRWYCEIRGITCTAAESSSFRRKYIATADLGDSCFRCKQCITQWLISAGAFWKHASSSAHCLMYTPC